MIIVPLAVIGVAAVGIGVGEFRIELRGPVAIENGLVELALGVVVVAAVGERPGEPCAGPLAGLDHRRAGANGEIGLNLVAETGALVDLILHGPGEILFHLVGDAEVEIGVRELRIEADGLRVLGDRRIATRPAIMARMSYASLRARTRRLRARQRAFAGACSGQRSARQCSAIASIAMKPAAASSVPVAV